MDKLVQFGTKMENIDPSDIEPGYVVKTQDGQLIEIDDILDTAVKGTPAEDDEDDTEIIINFSDCEITFSPHEFGQYKRFRPGGTGFSKQGRKLKHPRHYAVKDEDLDSYIDGSIDTEEVLEQAPNDVSGIVMRAFSNVISNRDIAQKFDRPDRKLKAMVDEFVNDYVRYVNRVGDCDVAVKSSDMEEFIADIVEIVANDVNASNPRKAIKEAQSWFKNNMKSVYCPT